MRNNAAFIPPSVLLEQMKQALYWNLKPKPVPRHGKEDNLLKNCLPISITCK